MREEIKASSVAAYIKKLLNLKDDVKDGLSDEEIVVLDYYEAIRYFYKGKEKPVALGFTQGVDIWLETTVGPIRLDEMPHEISLEEEVEILIGENGFDHSYLIELINKYLDEHWDK